MPVTRPGRRHRRTAWALVVGCFWLTTAASAYAEDSQQYGGVRSTASAAESARGEHRLVVAVEGLPRRGNLL